MDIKKVYIETKKRTYPLVFTLNVMEEIQEKYGSLDEWYRMTSSGGDGVSIKDIKFGVMAMINEAIDIVNEDTGASEPMVTDKEVGRIMTEIGIEGLFKKIQEITIDSTKSDDNEGKNE